MEAMANKKPTKPTKKQFSPTQAERVNEFLLAVLTWDELNPETPEEQDAPERVVAAAAAAADEAVESPSVA